MQLPKGTTVAVTDGEKFNLFRNAGDEADLKLTPLAHDVLNADHQGSTLSNGTGTGPRMGLQKGPRLTLGLERIGCGVA